MKPRLDRKNRIRQLYDEGYSKDEALKIIKNEYPPGIEWTKGHPYKSDHYKEIGTTYYECAQNGPPLKELIQDEKHDQRYPEGKEAYIVHRKLERNASLSEQIKRDRLVDKGELYCDVCGFSFSKTYGVLGDGYIEAHHIIPLHKGARESTKDDFALVCSNCHRMLHSGGKCLTIEELRVIVVREKK